MKILIAYYSRSGNTEKLAITIKKRFEARSHSVDVEKIKPVEEHSWWRWFFLRIFKGECEIREPKIKDVSEYDLFCIGSPNWTRLSLPAARYLREVKGLKHKSVGLFSTTALWPSFEWYIFSAYFLDLTFSRIIDGRGAKIIDSILFSSLFKKWSVNSKYGEKTIKDFCNRFEKPTASLKDYFLVQKEIESIRLLVVLLSAALFFSFIFQIISSILGFQIIVWWQYISLVFIGIFAFFSLLRVLSRKSEIFFGKYLASVLLVAGFTIITLFLSPVLARTILLGYVLILILISFFRDLKALLFTGLVTFLGYIILLFTYPQTGVLIPSLDLALLLVSTGMVGFVTQKLQRQFVKLLEAQDEIEQAKITSEIRIVARTRELRELAESLDEQVKERTKDLQLKIEELQQKTKEMEESRAALMNMLQDVDEAWRKTEEEKNKTLAIINNFADGLLVFDSENKLSLINPQAEIIFSVRSNDLIGKSIFELGTFSDLKSLTDLLKEKKHIFREEIKAGKEFILEVSALPILREGKKIGILVILHNITREKLVEKLKSEFVSLSAHQLRTPLSAIKWSISLLNEEVKEKDALMLINKISQANERMINLINDLLNVTRIEEGRYIYKPAIGDIKRIIKNRIDAVESIAKQKNIQLKLELEEDIPELMIDKEKISICLQNLIENAIKYTGFQGEVVVSLKYDRIKKEILFSVRDNGIGIPKDQQERVFTKFFRSANAMREETEGSGLGLYIAKNIVEAHNGKIWFESEEGKGATFFFSLPAKS